MPSFPLVSVIIPNYNHSKFLEERIESVLSQNFSNFEVIILDDGSTDGSLEIIQLYEEHPRIKKVITNKENSGSVFKQWVKGISLAKGKYLWIAESDDYADEKFLQKTVDLAEKCKDLGFVFTDSQNVGQRGKLVGISSVNNIFLNTIFEENCIFIKKKKASLFFISHILVPNASAVLFNRKVLLEAVDLNEMQTYRNVGDQFAYLSIYLKFNIGYINMPLNYRRDHENNTTSFNFSTGLIYKEHFQIIRYFWEELKDLKSSKFAFNYYLKKNFLKATDFFLFQEMEVLLRKLNSGKLISFKKYFYLSTYVLLQKKLNGKTFLAFRKEIKKVLSK